ncbi:MAG TPA: DUF4118 domain-containing protein [Myxococcota bacterium]
MERSSLIALAIVFYASMVLLIEAIEGARAHSDPARAPAPVVVGAQPRQAARVLLSRIAPFAWTLVVVAAATALSYALSPDIFAPEDVVMLYVAAIMFAAIRSGRAAAVFAAALSVLCFDFLFVPPRFTLSVASPRHLLTFSMMFAVGVILATLARRLKKQSIESALKKSSEELKTTLLSAVSHDLRTPLAAITGAATTLRDGGARVPDDERKALLDAIVDEGFHLERLVANLLDMTRIESGAMKPALAWVPIDEIVGGALARTESRFARHIDTHLDAKAPLVHVDPVLFELVLVNLLENAVKHTPAHAHIEVASSTRPGGGVDLVVSDDGPGVPAGVDVFERFVRGPGAGSGGVGLGLAIARGIVEAHGGTLRMEPSASESAHGASFRVALPAGDPPRALDAP